MKPSLLLIMPCYNEQEIIGSTINRTMHLINELIEKELISETSKLLFIDDGSKDNTWEIIKKRSDNKLLTSLKLSKNFDVLSVDPSSTIIISFEIFFNSTSKTFCTSLEIVFSSL